MANVLSFNGIEIPDFLRVTGITFPVTPELTVKETEIPRRYGNLDNGVKFGGKPISVSCVVVIPKGRNIHDLADEFKRWIKGDNWKPSKLVFGEQPETYLLSRVSSQVDISDLFLYGETELEFQSADPRKYASEMTSKSFQGNTGELTYDGIEKAPSIVEIVLGGDCGRITLTHEPSHKQVILTGTLVAGQKVTIDSDRKTVSINDNVEMTLLGFRSQWIYLEDGTNSFTISTDTTIESEMTVSYRKAD